MHHQLTIPLGTLALDALGAGSMQQVRAQVAHAIRYYLSDKEGERAGWDYPTFIDEDGGAAAVEVEVTLDSALWDALEQEAAEQRVSPQQLARHAVLYFVADREAGRVPRRIQAA